MSNQFVLLKNRGLFTFPNDLSEDPPGAFREAINVVVDRESVVEPRRGMGQFGDVFSANTADRARQIIEYRGRALVHYGSTMFGSAIAYDSTGLGDFASFSQEVQSADEFRLKTIESNGNLYMTTSEGIKKLGVETADQFSVTDIVDAGVPQALSINGVPVAGNVIPHNHDVGYRVVWGYTDFNGNLLLGAPSGLFVVTNTINPTGNIQLTFTIPKNILESPIVDRFFYQIYRTPSFLTPGPVGNDLNLVFEDFPTLAQITAGSITVVDSYPDELRASSTFLYTSANAGEGAINANNPPPFAKDITLYQGYAFYANTSTVQRREITLLTGDPTQLDGESITIDDGVNPAQTYTFVTTLPASPTEVQLSTSPSVGIQIYEAAVNLVNAINNNTAELAVVAFYDSNADELPGRIRLEHQDATGAQFNISVSAGIENLFDPTIPVGGLDSDNEVRPNRIYYSKFQQPEAVPLANFFDVGPRDKAILRIIALRDSLFVLKEDGIYRVSGFVAPFQVTLFDASAILLAPDSAVVLNNQIYCLTTQGVITITDTGVSVISRPIEDQLLSITREGFNFRQPTFGVSYESDRSYLLFTVRESTDNVATQVLRFNTFTRTWTRWVMEKTCGRVVNVIRDGGARIDDKMYLGPNDVNFIEQERKARNRTDYADRENLASIVQGEVNGAVVRLGSLLGIEVGDVLAQFQTVTTAVYNRLLRKLDQDPTVADSDYELTLLFLPGDDLPSKLLNLGQKLDADAGVAGTGYAAIALGPNPQIAFNTILSTLDLDSGVFFQNYFSTCESRGITEYEGVVLSLDRNEGTVTLPSALPFIAGNASIFKAIRTTVVWSPATFGDVSLFKQVSEGTMIFEDNNFSTATIGYGTDLSPGFENVNFSGSGNGNWGVFGWDGINWGGVSSAKPLRTYIPRQKQRCRFMAVRFQHANAREKFSLYGISLTFRPYSARAYR